MKNSIFLLLFSLFFFCTSFSQSTVSKTEVNLFKKYTTKVNFYLTKKNEDSITKYSKLLFIQGNTKKNYVETIDFIRIVGHYYEEIGAIEKSIDIYQKGMSMAESNNDYVNVSKMLVDISNAFRIFHEYQKAIKYGKKAVKILEKDTTSSLLVKADALSILAAAYSENKQFDSAVIHQETILQLLPKVDSTDIKTAIVNIAYTYMELGRLKESRLYSERGLALYKPTKNAYAIAAIYTNLAMYGNRANKLTYANRMFDSAIYYTKKSKYIETLFWIYDERAQVYKKQHKLVKAYDDLRLLLTIKDSVFKAKRDKSVQETEAKYKTAKKEKEIAQQKEKLLANQLEIKNKSLYTLLATSALLLLGILFFGVFKKNQFKRKQLQKEIDLKDALSKIKTQNRLQEQRLRISRDLHDNIGSQLTFIISSIDNLQFVTKDANDTLKNKLSTISSFTSDTIFQLRDTIWAMNKNQITSDDLHIRILSFTEKAKIASPNTTFIVDHSITKMIYFTSIIGVNLFRVIQEAINNAIKYADASEISVHASVEKQTLHITVKDNGNGFDITNIKAGNGLANMEKRMSEINGKIHISSKTTIGTTIKLTLVVKNTSNAV